MANQRLSAKIEIGASVDRTVAAALSGIQRSLKGVSAEIHEVEKAQKDLGKQREVLIKQGRAVEDLDREYADMGRTLDQLRTKQARYERVMVAGRRVGERFGAAVDSVRVGATAAAGAVGILAGAGIGLATQTANAAREVRMLSEVANAAPTEFQRWAAGAETVGIEQDKLADILKDVNDRVGDFVQTGGGPMADFFEKIAPQVGVTAEQFRELSGPEALQLYVESLEKAKVNQQDFTFYMEAMASDSTRLVPLLRNGGREMRRFGDAAEESGRILSDDALRAAKDYDRSLRELRSTGQAVRNTIGSALLPVVSRVADEMNRWIKDNRGTIDGLASRFTELSGKAIPIIGDIAKGFGDVATTIGNVTSTIADSLGGWENFGAVVGGIFAAGPILRIASFGVAVGRLGAALIGVSKAAPAVGAAMKALGTSLLFNPIGLAVAAIAGGAILIWQNWEQIKPKIQPVLDWFGRAAKVVGEAWTGFKETMGAVIDFVVGKFEAAYELIKDAVDKIKALGTAAKEIGSALTDPDRARMAAGGTTEEERQAILENMRRIDRGEPQVPLQKRAVGGTFDEGPLLVGEAGAELRYESRAGFIAHARHTRTMAKQVQASAREAVRPPRSNPQRGIVARAVQSRAAISQLPSAVRELSPAAAARASAGPTINITINQAPGQSPQAIIREIERKLNRRSGDLFDRSFA